MLCSDRVRIFQAPYKHLIYNENFIDLNLAKVGVEGSNPFARSSFPRKINGLENHFPAGGADFAVFGSQRPNNLSFRPKAFQFLR